MRLLMVGTDRALAAQCLAELAAAGFEASAVEADSIADAALFLADQSFDLVLLLWTSVFVDSFHLENFSCEPPLILVASPSETSQSVCGVNGNASALFEVISSESLWMLPRAARHAVEMERLRGQKDFAERHEQNLFELNPAGILRAALNGSLMDLNPASVRIFNFSGKSEAVGRSLKDFCAPGEFDRLTGPLLAGQPVAGIEVEFRRASGEPLWAIANAAAFSSEMNGAGQAQFEVVFVDVTEQKKAEEALRQSETRFKALVENSSDAISLVDATGKVLLSSHAVSPIFGYALEERVGKNVFELIHPDDQEQVARVFRGLLAAPASSATTQVRYRHKNGSWRWIEALGTNMLADPSVRAVVINYRDITERRLLLQQLFQAQKMEAVGQLAGGVAHDFNNLLTAILGYSDMAMEKLPRNSAARRYTGEIKKAGERAASLTRQLLAFSRLQVMAPQVMDLNAVISDLGKMLRRLIGEDVRLVVIPGSCIGRVKVDPTQIEQVIMNLAVNARDAMPGGGKLVIETSNVVLPETVTAEGVRLKPGDYVLMEVSDTGTGMDKETRAHIFEPFFTTKEKGKGTGLGLSTVYGIVKQSGGYIWVSSEPGQGTAFKIYLPAVEEDLSAPKPRARHEHKHMGSETILLVEDEDSVRAVLGKMLRGMGYHVLEAEIAQDALDLARRYEKTIHLLLTDVAMPRMNGQQLARLVGEMHPEAMVLFMTGYAGNKVGSTSVLEENSEFIHKPFTTDALGQKIRRILDETHS